MPAAKKKLLAVVEALPEDPLPAAIAAKQQTYAALVAKQEALQRARDNVAAAEASLEKSKANIPKAKETDIRTAATNLDKGVNPVVPWHTRSAISDVERDETVLEIADAARTRKREEIKVAEDDDAEAENNIRVCIKQRTKAEVLRQLEELQQVHRREAILQRSIAEYLDNDPRYAPRFHDFMRSHRAEAARNAVFADVKDLAAYVLCGLSTEDHEAGLEAAKAVKAALLALRTDPSTKLPEV